VSPTAVGEEKGSRDPWVRRGRQWGAGARRRRDLGWVEGGGGEPGRDGDGILGASREAVGSRGETATAMLGRNKFLLELLYTYLVQFYT
jgi:hypothetical protein